MQDVHVGCGFMASSAALAACALARDVTGALIFAHGSAETAYGTVLRHLGAKPILELEPRLGEGSAARFRKHIQTRAAEASGFWFTPARSLRERPASSLLT